MAMNLKTLIVLLLVSFSIQLTDADRIDCGKKNPRKRTALSMELIVDFFAAIY